MNHNKEMLHIGQIETIAGDGINDVPFLSGSIIGISFMTGKDIIMQSSEITLVKGNLNIIDNAGNLSADVVHNIKQNLYFACLNNMPGVTIAAKFSYYLLGFLLRPIIEEAVIIISSVSVISNPLRLK